MNDYDRVIAAYSEAAPALVPHYDGLPAGGGFDSVEALLPDGSLALDIGAGSGRDAAWLSRKGFEVVAVEPAPEMRVRGEALHQDRSIRWLDDRLPGLEQTHRLGLAFDVILLSAVWQHVEPADRPRALRKLTTLLRPGGVMLLSLRNGPAPAGRPMHPTSVSELEGLARVSGLEVVRVSDRPDLQARREITWSIVCLRLPDDGTGALPLVRGIILADGKSSTYKLGLLRAVARIAEQAPGTAAPTPGAVDSIDVPLGLVALNWVRLYLPLVRAGLPQAPRNSGPDGLAFAKVGFRGLLDIGACSADLRIGAPLTGDLAQATSRALGEAAATIAAMPARFTRYPNSDAPVFGVARARGMKPADALILDRDTLASWGILTVPGHLWRALSRHGAWIEPMLVAEWARLMRGYGDRAGQGIAPGVAEAALAWDEPVRTTALGRLAAERLIDGAGLNCVWTGRALRLSTLDIDHCLPWAVWPCGDLWNLAPCDRRVNQHEKRDRLPSAALFADARERLEAWWTAAYLSDAALGARFLREAAAALPLAKSADAASVYAAMDWRRLRLRQDQQVPEWGSTNSRER